MYMHTVAVYKWLKMVMVEWLVEWYVCEIFTYKHSRISWMKIMYDVFYATDGCPYTCSTFNLNFLPLCKYREQES